MNVLIFSSSFFLFFFSFLVVLGCHLFQITVAVVLAVAAAVVGGRQCRARRLRKRTANVCRCADALRRGA